MQERESIHYQTGAVSVTDAPQTTIADEAGKALIITDNLHSMLDDLETRLFGPELRAVGTTGAESVEKSRPALAHTIKGTRQRLDTLTDRVSRILNRL